MKSLRRARIVGMMVLAAALSVDAEAAPVVFSAGGDSTTASIQATVDAFRSALGDSNGNTAGPLPAGRREINWDGGGATTSTPAATPFDGFLDTRGVRFVTPGTGFTQATDEGLGAINATYPATFGFFSPLRMFTPIGSTITDALFFVPGTNGADPATVAGFGAVFSDVDVPASTLLQFFDGDGMLLSAQPVPTGTVANESLSFLGVVFTGGERVARVRITTGNAALGPNDGPLDVVVMDDVIYSEPQSSASQPVPEPSTLLLLASVLGGSGLVSWRRRRA